MKPVQNNMAYNAIRKSTYPRQSTVTPASPAVYQQPLIAGHTMQQWTGVIMEAIVYAVISSVTYYYMYYRVLPKLLAIPKEQD